MVATVQPGNVLAFDILKALGIDGRRVMGVSINLSATQIASVTITRALDGEDCGKLASAMERYAVVRIADQKA